MFLYVSAEFWVFCIWSLGQQEMVSSFFHFHFFKIKAVPCFMFLIAH